MRKRFKDLKPDDIVLVGQVDLSNEAEIAGNLDVRHLANGPGLEPDGQFYNPPEVFWRGDGVWRPVTGPGNDCCLLCGPGEPEGAVVGDVGCIYEQTDRAATSHPIFVKRSGTGNTGWRGWGGLRGEDPTSFAIGDNTSSTGARSIAFGDGSEALGDDTFAALGALVSDGIPLAIAMGPGSVANATRSVIIGGISFPPNMQAQNEGDVIIGWDHVLGRLADDLGSPHPNVVIGLDHLINQVSDPESLSNAVGGHVMIGEFCEAPYDQTDWPSILIGQFALSHGRAVIAIGQNAEARAINNPVSGRSEGVFATLIGYQAKGSGGCIVAIGDQSDVRGDNSIAAGTHARANDHSTAAFGPSAFAGSVNSDDTGEEALAVGKAATATGLRSSSFGASATTGAPRSLAIGYLSLIDAAHDNSIALGAGATTTASGQLMIGSSLFPITEVVFNGGTGAGSGLAFTPGASTGTNQPGANTTIKGGVATGNATPGAILFQTTRPGASGTTAQTLGTRMRITGDGVSVESSFALPITTTTTSITLTNDHYTVVVNSASSRTVTLPTAASCFANGSGRVYNIKRAGTGSVTIQADGAELIDFANTYVIPQRGDSIQVQSDGTQWWVT